MELQDFIQNFADQFDDIDASAINGNTEFKALDDWNSLVALSVIAMVDEEYDVTIKGDDIRNAKSVTDLYNIVISKM